MNHLAIDTATEILSVALEIERSGSRSVHLAVRDVGLKHTGRLMVLVEHVIREAGLSPGELDLVSCMRGPGSFTGLRIGMSTAKGLAWAIAEAKGKDTPPVVSVPTLSAMAASVPPLPGVVVLPVIDGRKNRFYGAGFVGGARATPDFDRDPDGLVASVYDAVTAGSSERSNRWIVTGPHAPEFIARLGDPPAEFTLDPGYRGGWARSLLGLGRIQYEEGGPDEIDAGPDYLRLSEAEESLRARTDSV